MDYEVRAVRADEWRQVRELRLAALQDPVADIAFLETYETAVDLPDAFWQQRAEGAAEGADGVRQFVAEAADGSWLRVRDGPRGTTRGRRTDRGAAGGRPDAPRGRVRTARSPRKGCGGRAVPLRRWSGPGHCGSRWCAGHGCTSTSATTARQPSTSEPASCRAGRRRCSTGIRHHAKSSTGYRGPGRSEERCRELTCSEVQTTRHAGARTGEQGSRGWGEPPRKTAPHVCGHGRRSRGQGRWSAVRRVGPVGARLFRGAEQGECEEAPVVARGQQVGKVRQRRHRGDIVQDQREWWVEPTVG